MYSGRRAEYLCVMSWRNSSSVGSITPRGRSSSLGYCMGNLQAGIGSTSATHMHWTWRDDISEKQYRHCRLTYVSKTGSLSASGRPQIGGGRCAIGLDAVYC